MFKQVYHDNKWVDVYIMKKIKISEINDSFMINNEFNLFARDRIKYFCSTCGKLSEGGFKFRKKFFDEKINCKSCDVNRKRKTTWLAKYGVDHPMKTEQYREKYSIYFSQHPSMGQLGKKASQETRKKMSESHIGNKNACGERDDKAKKNISRGTMKALKDPIIRKKMRVKCVERMQNSLKNGNQISPNWNPKACDYFEQFDGENNTRDLHARNGGEFYIKELGYWVDYINHDLKLIMEYDEKYHLRKKQKEKDERRQSEIENVYPNYKFIRIKEHEIQ